MIIEKVFNFIDSVSYWSGKLVSILVLIAGTLLCVEVVARYIFNSPIVWIPFVTTELCAVYYFMVGAYALLFKSHVGMDIFSDKLSKNNQTRLGIFTFVFFLLFCGTLLWTSYEEMLFSVKILETTPPPWYGPLWPIKIFLVLGVLLLLLQGIANFCRDHKVSYEKELL
jgi:TRAP-type mannitol/chloroaromatic compound transport system permease small subunit